MLHSAESTAKLDADLAALAAQHDEECDQAASIEKEAISRVLRDKAIGKLYDRYTEESSRAQLRQLCTGRVPNTPIDIAHAHQLVEQCYGDLLQAMCDDVHKHLDQFVAVQKGYVHSVLEPKLQERFQDFVREDHFLMCQRLSDRISFVEHEFQTRAASIANREGRFFSAHVADLLRQVATSHQRAVDAEAAAGIPAGSSQLPFNPLAENQTEAAQLERNVLNSLNPDSLKELPDHQAKSMLVSAQQRERVLWATVDRLQEIVRVAAEKEEQRRSEFQKKLTEELGTQSKLLQVRNEELTSELTRSRLETVEAVKERDDASIMAYKLDEMCSKLNLELTALFRVAKEQGVVSGEFSRIEEQLKKLESRSCTGEPFAVPTAWDPKEAPGTRDLLKKLKNNPITVPDPTTLRQQQDMLRGVLDYYQVREENERLKGELRAKDATIMETKKLLVETRYQHEKERRRLTDGFSASLQRLKSEHKAMRSKAMAATISAATASTQHIACSDPVVDDLMRKLAGREARIRELELALHMDTATPTQKEEDAEPKSDPSTNPAANRLSDIKKYLEADLRGGKLRAMYSSTDAITASPRRTNDNAKTARPKSGSAVQRDPHGAQLKAAYQSMCKTPRPPSAKTTRRL